MWLRILSKLLLEMKLFRQLLLGVLPLRLLPASAWTALLILQLLQVQLLKPLLSCLQP